MDATLDKLSSLCAANMWRSVEMMSLLAMRESEDTRYRFELRLLHAKALTKIGELRKFAFFFFFFFFVFKKFKSVGCV
jgi:hypothetical protein